MNSVSGDKMLESVTFQRSETKDHGVMDLGLLAETLLFYRQAHLLLDRANLNHLLKTIGPATTQRLVTLPSVRPLLVWENLGVVTKRGAVPVYDFAQIQIVGRKGKPFLKSKEGRIKHLFERSLGKSGATNKAAIAFSKAIKVQKLSEGVEDSHGFAGIARQDLVDPGFVHQAIAASLEEKIPNTPLGEGWHFVPHQVKDGFIIDTNLDFARLNEEYRKYWPDEHSALTPAYLLTDLLEANVGQHYASLHGSDVITSPSSSRIMQLKIRNAVEKRFKSVTEIDLFQKVTIGNGNAIREAINSGERTFDEFLDLLDHASQFKGWLANQEPEQSLIQDYYSEVAAGTWAEKLPGKTFRWSFFTGAGILLDIVVPTGLGTATGMALSAGDAFLLDKVIKGWKPNQFVEGPMRQFTD